MSKNILSKANNLPGLLVGLIIRPPRAKYDIEHLGPTKFTVDDRVCERYDLELKNERGLVLKCSHFMQVPAMPSPCVIYLHGNCGCRLDAFESVAVALRDGISLFCFDFAGSGLSEGEYISLGFYERDDVRTVVEYLRGVDHVTTIGLWGRSMGAATAIMYGATDPSIAGMVLDSPFTSLPKLAGELVTSKELPIQIPKVAFNVGLKAIRKSIKHKVKFDIEELVPIKYVDQCFAPALFIHGESDTFILPHHGEELYEAYAGDKNYILVEGDHNSLRPAFCNDSVSIFFRNTLLAGHDLYPSPREIYSKPEVLAIPSLEELELYKDLPRIAIERPQDLCEDDELQQALLLSLSDPGQVDSSALFEFADAIEEKMGESINEGAVIEKKYTEEPEKDKKSNRKVEKKGNKKSEKPEKKEKKSKKRKFRKLTFSKKKLQKRISVPEPLYQEEVQEDLEKVGKKEKKKKEKTKKHLKTEIPELEGINETPSTYSKQSEERSTDLPEVCAPKSSKRKRKKKRRSSLTAPKVQRSFSDVN